MPNDRDGGRDFIAVLWGKLKPLAHWSYQNVRVRLIVSKQTGKKIKECNDELMLYIVSRCYLDNTAKRMCTINALSINK